MAIKISGTTVITDNRELTNIESIGQVLAKPTIFSPTDGETNVDFDVTIQGSGFNATIGNRQYRQFQVDLSTGDFSNPVVNELVNADSLTVDDSVSGGPLSSQTNFKVRIRDADEFGNLSPYSDVVSFTTGDNPLEVLGSAVCGGFYMGTIGTSYYLIVAPVSEGQNCCQWKTTSTETSGASSRTDGFDNTYTSLNNSTHPAGNWTATRTIGGFSEWYLPAIEELRLFYDNGGGAGPGSNQLPPGEDFITNAFYWSSTEEAADPAGEACVVCFANGGDFGRSKTSTYRVRAVRRIPI
jgi:hypothetical protein